MNYTCRLVVYQRHLAAVVVEDEVLVVQPEEVEQGGVVVVVIHDIFDCTMTLLVGLAVNVSFFEAAAGDPHAKAVGVVIPADLVRSCGILDDWKSSQLASPVTDRGVQQAALLEIDDESGRTLVGHPARPWKSSADFSVMVSATLREVVSEVGRVSQSFDRKRKTIWRSQILNSWPSLTGGASQLESWLSHLIE